LIPCAFQQDLGFWCYSLADPLGLAVPESLYKFGEFELDDSRFELRRNGRVLKLERIPMELLILLAEKDGHVVTRQEIVERLWGKDVFVDTEHGINTAIRKIRAALHEDAERPRFVQTVMGKGYRFSGVEKKGASAVTLPAEKATPAVDDAVPSGTTKPRGRWRIAAIAAIVLILIAGALLAANFRGMRDRLFATDQKGPIHSIAVIPLANLSGDPAQDYFADGMTDELITMLARNTSLRVVSRTSAMQYKGVQRPVRDIARELGVDGILEGSVERSGNRVHMTVQLIYAPSDTHIWAQSYDRDTNEVFSLPSELSQAIAKEVKTAVSPGKSPRYVSPEAHDAYLQGLYTWYGTAPGRSQEYFEKAIRLQPDYAAAWSGLANAYLAHGVLGDSAPQEVMGKAEAAIHKSLELDDSLAEAHNAQAAFYLFSGWDWLRAESESLRSIQLNPNYSEGHHLHSLILLVMNRDDEALQEQKAAIAIDPFAEPSALGQAYIQLRRYDAAIHDLRSRLEAQPGNTYLHFTLSEAYWLKGMWKESEQELESGNRLAGDPKMAEMEHQAYEKDGEKGAEQLGVDIARARARKQYVSPYELASACAFLGDKEETLKFLEAALRARSPWLVLLQKEPVFDFLHSEERYRNIVKEIGLPPMTRRVALRADLH
jgi:TolB-like protein/DNA-binding winged helix-turn-helix (wHTH) protein/tetratricopeptide (TPR) repeat protein